MYIAYSPQQEALPGELRAHYEDLLTPRVRQRLHEGHGTGETLRAIVRPMGRDYPLHRLFPFAERVELELGGSSRQLLAIGSRLAEQPD